MLKNEKLAARSSSHQSSSKMARRREDGGTNRQRSRVIFKTSNTPSLQIDRNLPDQYTPNTDFDDYLPDMLTDLCSQTPDLTVKCKKCGSFLNLQELADHNRLHNALAFFGFDELTTLTLDRLNAKRYEFLQLCLNKYLYRKSSLALNAPNRVVEWRSKFAQLNDHYEIIKSHLTHRFESFRQRNTLSVAKASVNTQSWLGPNELIVAIGSCSTQNQKHRIQMEDSSVVIDKLGNNPNLVYSAVFDGYDGDISSRRCSSQLHLAILDMLSRTSLAEFDREAFEFDEINHLNKYEKVRDEEGNENFEKIEIQDGLFQRAFKTSYQLMDALLARGHGETSKVRWSGATASSCIIEQRDQQGWIHIANCGDVEAILIYDSSKGALSPSYPRKNFKVLTKLHTVNSCIKDRDTIERKGGKLLETSNGQKKISGLYSMTRGLGFHGDKHVKSFISSRPSVNSVPIEPKHAALIIATKGLWSVLSYDQVSELVLQCLPCGRKVKPERVTSPSVRALIVSHREKLKDKSNLLHRVVHDKEEGELNQVDEGSETSIESNTIKKTFSVSDESGESESGGGEKPETRQKFHESNARPRTAPSLAKRRENENPRKCFSDICTTKIDDVTGEYELDLGSMSVDKLYFKPEAADELGAEEAIKLKLKSMSWHVVQVDEGELKRFARSNMPDQEEARRLDLVESVSEMLVNAALIAGSTDNITVNCVLLPGSIMA